MIIKYNKIIVVLGCFLLTCLSAEAETKQTVTINGVTSELAVTTITFDGDNVTLTFSDNTTQTEDMADVSIALEYSTSDGITEVLQTELAEGDQRVYNLKGQLVGNSLEGLRKGIYITNGKKVVVK